MSAPLNVLIIEDETPAVEKLERYLQKYNPNTKIAGVCDSVETAIAWLKEKQSTVDLIFMDIQLKDDVSFKIFQGVKVVKPVIFITAYNEYALDAFKVSSIDYLLKPVTFDDLSASLQKLENLRNQLNVTEEKLEKIKSFGGDGPAKTFKNRFMVKVGDHIRSVTTDQVIFFYADGRDVYLVTQQMRKFIIDFTLEALEEVLDPKIFFRANRTYILNIHAIHDVVMYSNSRLKITTQPAWDKEIIVSREKVNEFKSWFDGQG
ncbi:MAG TPA: LytTR family DNA-binding domain-containing protein [Cyclobacteriaceae bacterium]|nr:LytTR family DNA-binding domain-containing protein [Cyclobacteriaceae bacterium]